LEEKLKNNSLLNYLREKAQKKLFSKQALKEKLKKEKLAVKEKSKVFFFNLLLCLCLLSSCLTCSSLLSTFHFILTFQKEKELKKKKIMILKNSSEFLPHDHAATATATDSIVSSSSYSESSSSFANKPKKKREKFSKKGGISGLLSTTSVVYEGNHVNSAEEQHHYPSDSPLSNSILPHGLHDEPRKDGGTKKKFSILKKETKSATTQEIPSSLIASLIVNSDVTSSAGLSEIPPTEGDVGSTTNSSKLSRREKAKFNREKYSVSAPSQCTFRFVGLFCIFFFSLFFR
jgi:hypothetical protein